jgi:hypothetical protein
MTYEKTLKIVTDLDRPKIEAKLREIRSQAQKANLAALAKLFDGVEGMPRAELEKRVRNALKWLTDKPEHSSLRSHLDLVELNLPNLK